MMRSLHVVATVMVCEMPRYYEVGIELKGSETIGLQFGVSLCWKEYYYYGLPYHIVMVRAEDIDIDVGGANFMVLWWPAIGNNLLRAATMPADAAMAAGQS